ncbi:hypothetical protein ACFVX3_30205 [Rhodococcus erythropolis]
MSSEVVGYLVVCGVVGLICAMIAGAIASRKDRSQGGFFTLGLFFGPIAILAAVLVAPGRPTAPYGMRAEACPRCNAQQNVTTVQSDYECWQCKLISPVGAHAARLANGKQDWQDWLKEGKSNG